MTAVKKASKVDKIDKFVTSRGITVILHGIPPLTVPRLTETVDFPDKPVYMVETATGEIEEHAHDEKTLVTDEDKAAWAVYIELLEEADSVLTSKVMRAVLIEGVEVEPQGAKFATWKKRQELMGMPVSDDKEEMLLHYKETVVVGNVDDMQQIVARVMKQTGVPQEEIDALITSFPDKVESES